jgi:hypothetical protein
LDLEEMGLQEVKLERTDWIDQILGLRRDVDKICVLLGYYAASCGNCLPTFRDNISVPSSRVKSLVQVGTGGGLL